MYPAAGTACYYFSRLHCSDKRARIDAAELYAFPAKQFGDLTYLLSAGFIQRLITAALQQHFLIL
jgi:hypothetical protein